MVNVDRRTFFYHRILWVFHYGPIPPGMQIDHIDHDRSNNRIENLRLVTHSENQRNLSRFKNNTSGHAGIRWSKEKNKWRTRIHNRNKEIHLGYYNDLDEAIEIRRKAEILYGFHPNHGKEKATPSGVADRLAA